MGELVEWLSHGDLDAPAHVRAAMAHLHLASIQPFREGNGRVARTLHNLVLARAQRLPPEVTAIDGWVGEPVNLVRYYEALRTTQGGRFQPERDARPWIEFVLTAHHRQAQRVRRRCAWHVLLGKDFEALAAVRGAGRDPYR